MEKNHHVDFIVEQLNKTENTWREWARYDLLDSAYANYSKITDGYPERFYRLIKRTVLVSKETIDSSESISVEYAIQRKVAAEKEWVYYTKNAYVDLDKAVEMINFFRKTSPGEQFRLIKKTNTISIEQV